MAKTTQNELTDALTSAISAIADSSVQSKDATLTIEAEIVEIIDEGLGIYKVKYLGNIFEAITTYTEVTYSIGDMVYVVIPNGNFDKNKIILSPVAPSVTSFAYASTGDNINYVSISDNLFREINNIYLSTWKPHEPTQYGNYYFIDSTGFQAMFDAALQDSRIFNFTCKIQTKIDKDRRGRGNYGLELHIPVVQNINGIDTPTEYVTTLDVNNIIGDPYGLLEPTLQNIYFTFPDDMVYKEDYNHKPLIKTFVRDFPGEDSGGPDDIIITDIQLLSTLAIEKENMSGYYSVITSNNGGNSFLPGRTSDEKILGITLYLNGKVVKTNDFDCYWFKENVGIHPSSDKYHRIGGGGWEILNEVSEVSYSEDGKIHYQYITDIYTQKVLQSEIHCDTKFKCVLFKNDGNKGKQVISTVIIKNLASTAIIELSSVNGLTTFSKGVGDVELQLKYYENGITDYSSATPPCMIGCNWQRIDKDGNIIDDFPYTVVDFNKRIIENNKTFYYTKIKFPINIINKINTIGCTVYIETTNDISLKKQTIGTKSIIINIGNPINGYIETTNGDKLYKYDADGNSPMVADYDGPMSSTIKVIDPISIRIYKNDGTELNEDEYKTVDIHWLVPIDSMLSLSSAQKSDTTTNVGYYTIKGKYNNNNQLSYNILSSYNKNKSDNNSIIIRAFAPTSVLSGMVEGIATLRFIKDGEGGTNGSKYAAIVTYDSYGYGEYDIELKKKHKFQLIYAADTNKWYGCDTAYPGSYTLFTVANFAVSLYVDGSYRIPTDIGYDKDITWKIFDQDYEKYGDIKPPTSPVTFEGRDLVLNGKKMSGSNDPFCAIIEAKIRCNRDSQEGNAEYVYAYYPIECSYVAKESYLENFILTIDGGFSEVLYGSDGSNPQWDKTESFKIENAYLEESLNDFFNTNWTRGGNLTLNVENKECFATPFKKFDGGQSKNYIGVSLYSSSSYINNITTIINQLTQENNSLQNRKNYYQTLQNNLNVFTNFNYQYNAFYKNQIKNILLICSIKTNLTITIKTLLDQISQLQSICDQYKIKEDGSIDNKINIILDEITAKMNILNRLRAYISSLGVVPEAINQIKNIATSNLILRNKIDYIEGIPERDCYFIINDNINLYNDTVNEVYAYYLNSLNDSNAINSATSLVNIINFLNNFANSSGFNNLTKPYYDCYEERYRYQELYNIIENRLDSTYYDQYSYNSVVENIINPILNDLSWYISFTSNGGYTPTINKIQSQIQSLNDKIQNLTKTRSIMQSTLISTLISHYKPIIFLYNRYELGFLNEWDGNKLELGDGYLVAPQIGAGIKNSDNSFTGIVLGIKKIKEGVKGDIGLFGYNQGIQSLFLNAKNGSAIFGEKGAGQIIIEPSSKEAIIKSGNYNDNNQWIFKRVYPNYDANPVSLGLYEYKLVPGTTTTNPKYDYVLSEKTRAGTDTAYYEKTNSKAGMLIDLSTPEIKFGTGNFLVSKEGHITAKGGGTIAGWEIGDTDLFSKVTGEQRITLHTGGTGHYDPETGTYIYDYPKIYSGTHEDINSSNAGFYLGPNGISITGKYNESGLTKTSHFRLTTTGNPKLFSGGHDTLNSSREGFYLSQDGFSIGSKVYIDDTGTMRLGNGATTNTGKHWVIDGRYSNSSISYVNADDDTESVYIGTDIIRLGKADGGKYPFSVTSRGKLYAKDAEIEGKITATTGEIGGWKIDGTTLKSKNNIIKLNSEGSHTIEGSNSYLDLGGGGDFSGCHINGSTIVFSTSNIGVTVNHNDSGVRTGRTGNITIDGTELHFVHGLLVD